MKYDDIVSYIKGRIGSFVPEMAIICGSGLTGIAQELMDVRKIRYSEIPGFVECSVSGHSGEMIFGFIYGKPVVCLSGRVHLYEGLPKEKILVFIRVLKLLGCKSIIITNAVGGIKESISTGDFVLIKDHINFQFSNVLVGKNDDSFGSRFSDMTVAYNKEMRRVFFESAKNLGLKLVEGVYFGVVGPSFETPAEIKAFGLLGGDVVGMSTVQEVIAARHCGMEVAAISVVTNSAAGLSQVELSHEETLTNAKKASENLRRLIAEFVKNCER